VLSAGTTLGSYEVLAPLGAGGMGEVYRARDTKLGREVAIKILPESFAQDPERLARFQREAQMLAALNHPHIGAIHGLEEAAGARFLVLEFVDGESLAQRLERQPSALSHQPSRGLAVAEALAIARQIVAALEAAHDKGIIHRDLKAANIMLTHDGQVKVLDFGLAKLDAGSGGSGGPGELTHSPTLTFAATQAGVILGTAAYMSPEQAKGRAADKRSDVWAFGCVLFEMLTGTRAFQGEDVSDTLAAILRGEPDWTAFPADMPQQIQVIVRRCLAKDRKTRIPDLSVVRFMMDEAPVSSWPNQSVEPVGPAKAGRYVRELRVWQAAAALLLLTTLAAGGVWYASRAKSPAVTRFFVSPPEKAILSSTVKPALRPPSRRTVFFLPDAHHVLFYATATLEEMAGVYVASLDTGDSKRILGADTGAIYSSRGASLLFVRQGTLMAQSFDPKMLTLADEPFPVAERVESRVITGVISFSVSEAGILSYGIGSGPAAGLQMVWIDRQGKVTETVGPDANYQGLALSPDSKRIAAHRHEGQGGDIWVTELTRRTTSRFTFDASQDNSSPVWSPDGSDIVFASLRSGKWGLYRKSANNAGNEERLLENAMPKSPTSWSTDGRSIVFQVLDPKTVQDLWILPLAGDRQPVSWLQTPFRESHGQISPDGKWLAYMSSETSRVEVYVRPFPTGAGKWQISTDGGAFPVWRGDGRELFYLSGDGSKLVAVETRSSGATFEAGVARELFEERFGSFTSGGGHPYSNYAVSADGQRFLVARPVAREADNGPTPIAVVVNWTEGLRK
jgi:hypothetical protein